MITTDKFIKFCTVSKGHFDSLSADLLSQTNELNINRLRWIYHTEKKKKDQWDLYDFKSLFYWWRDYKPAHSIIAATCVYTLFSGNLKWDHVTDFKVRKI